MSSKPSNTALSLSCGKHRRNPSVSEKKVKIKLPKKVVISKKWHQNCSHDAKSRSTGGIDTKQVVKPKMTTRSESIVSRNTRSLDFCKKCGDTDDEIATAVSEYTGTTKLSNKTFKTNTTERDRRKVGACSIDKENKYYKNEDDYITELNNLTSRTSKMNVRNDDKFKNNDDKDRKKEIIQEYYKNDKFESLYDSAHEISNGLRNIETLDTITEVNEKSQSQKASTESKMLFIDSSDEDNNLKRLKQFRDKNYFECHSAAARVDNKGCVISLKDHKCSYRFFLNDRLFPEAVNKDYNDNVRCVECHLPLEMSNDEVGNGTIQAKVTLGNDTQDTMLLLPVKAPLIVQQRKKERTDREVVYFGVIRLDQNGNSIFNRTLPSDSLALKYQKGYREFANEEKCKYRKVDEGDLVVI